MKCLHVALMVIVMAASPVFAESANKVQKDPQFTFKLGGLLMYDAAWYQGHDALQGKTPGYTDETGFRRARLSAQGSVYGDWDYNVTLDVTNALNNVRNADPVEIWQASVAYSGFRAMKIKAGQFYESFSLEAATSSRATTFMERGLPYTFSPVRSVGIGISAAPAKVWGWRPLGSFSTSARAANGLWEDYRLPCC